MAGLLTISILATGAVLLDAVLGEPRRWHPLVGFGRLAQAIEARCHRPSRWAGGLALVLAVAPWGWMAWLLAALPSPWCELFSLWALYFALGLRSLHDHVGPIVTGLAAGDEGAARSAVARIVSRDAETLDIAASACETVLENGNDGVFGALFWFCCAGAPGVIVYRLVNTLDAMWGYRSPRYLHFGWAAARLDDGLNWLPARLTALSYALLGHTRQALTCWRRQAPTWDSPNSGPVMAAGAGALGIRLGGPARYGGEWHARPPLGVGAAPSAADIGRALGLVRQGVTLWLALLLVLGLAMALGETMRLWGWHA